MCSSSTALSLGALQHNAHTPASTARKRVKNAYMVRQWDKRMYLLPHRLREYQLSIQLQWSGREYRRTDLPNLGISRIHVKHYAVLAAAVPWDEEHSRLQTVRAIGSFHGRPFFDNVAVQVHKGAQDAVEYAQLLLLFTAKLVDAQGQEDIMDLAYVRWYKASTRGDDVLKKYGATPLAYERVSYDPASRENNTTRESIIPLSSILHKVYIIQDFKKGQGHFHLSPFKHL